MSVSHESLSRWIHHVGEISTLTMCKGTSSFAKCTSSMDLDCVMLNLQTTKKLQLWKFVRPLCITHSSDIDQN